uniref:Probable imidazolonepropionase n=1 Tax=Ciona intestinalis TaxID=7719 RepID=F6Z3S5_CIOIN|nr:probable imidazolonepropionase [Ciona intestinalis]|eukprot:XP_002125327.1 probable imidazolonepropionase [Ciona intestinalis]
MESCKLLIAGLKQVVQVCKNGERMLVGDAMNDVAIMQSEDGNCGYSIVVDSDGNIHDIDTDKNINHKYNGTQFEKSIDGRGCCVIPGLVDAHTHPVWAGDRVHEFAMKLAGASYMEVHQAGGGIHYTVEHTRAASENELYQLLKQRLTSMVKCGTTLVECKSGYGLDTESELKMLRVINQAKKNKIIDISTTYCGAHAVPKGSTSEEMVNDIITNQLPKLKQEIDSGKLQVDNIDVFCEKGVFNAQQTRKILEEGVKMGLMINFHGDELSDSGSAKLGAELKAQAISHLEEISDEGIKEMSKSHSVAVILPTTAYILRLKAPPVRKMIKAGVPVALGSDFNPNAYCMSMPVVMHLACVNFHMTMAEALTASTINAAAALGMSDTHGSLEVGKKANFVIIDAPRWEHLVYQFGCHDDVIKAVVLGGDIIHMKHST